MIFWTRSANSRCTDGFCFSNESRTALSGVGTQPYRRSIYNGIQYGPYVKIRNECFRTPQTLFSATMNGVFRSRNKRNDSRVCCSSPCCGGGERFVRKISERSWWIALTMISTTRIAMLHSELPRDRKFVKDSCPGVSMMSKPGILYSCFPSYCHLLRQVNGANVRDLPY